MELDEDLMPTAADFEEMCADALAMRNRAVEAGGEALADGFWPVVEMAADLAAEARRAEALD